MNEVDFLRQMAPSGDDPAAAEAVARERLSAAIAAEVEMREASRWARQRAKWRRRLPAMPATAVGALAAAVLVIFGVVVAVRSLAPAPATAQLGELAEVAAATEFPRAAEGSSVYTRSEVAALIQELTTAGTVSFVSREVVETWTATDGSVLIRTTRRGPEFFDEQQRVRYDAAGLDATYGAGVQKDDVYGNADRPADYRDLPSDLASVEQFIFDQAGEGATAPPADRLLDLAAVMLATTASTPELRASVLRILDGLDQIQVSVDDAAEPPVLTAALEYGNESGAFRRELVFDADSSVLLADSIQLLSDSPEGVPAGTYRRDARFEPPRVVTGPPPAAG